MSTLPTKRDLTLATAATLAVALGVVAVSVAGLVWGPPGSTGPTRMRPG